MLNQNTYSRLTHWWSEIWHSWLISIFYFNLFPVTLFTLPNNTKLIKGLLWLSQFHSRRSFRIWDEIDNPYHFFFFLPCGLCTAEKRLHLHRKKRQLCAPRRVHSVRVIPHARLMSLSSLTYECKWQLAPFSLTRRRRGIWKHHLLLPPPHTHTHARHTRAHKRHLHRMKVPFPEAAVH